MEENTSEPKSVDKQRITILVPKALAERLKNAIFYTPGHYTVSNVATAALERAVRFLERKYRKGEPFERRKSELKGGRPLK
jgi:hypothetical protein